LLLEAEWNAGEGEDGGGELGGLRHSETVGGSLALLLYGLKRKKKLMKSLLKVEQLRR
jgi:hypothetical protein